MNRRSIFSRVLASTCWLVVVASSMHCFSSNAAAQSLETHNAFISATLEPTSGLLNFYGSPGLPNGVALTSANHSYLAVKIGSTVQTNNPEVNTGLPGGLDARLAISKVGDTLIATWLDAAKSGMDMIQKVYPATSGNSGVMIISVSLVNRKGQYDTASAQYLYDLEIGQNDRPRALTPYGYTFRRTQFALFNPGIPPYFVTFAKDLPNGPSYATSPSAEGLLNAPEYGLQIPDRVTIGDWTQLSSQQWGPFDDGSAAVYGDAAILLEWPRKPIPPNTTVEIMRTAYGPTDLVTCNGGLFAVFDYPHALVFDTASSRYVGNPFDVKALLFNPDEKLSAEYTGLRLNVGPQLKIVSPATNLSTDSTSEALSAPNGTIAPGGVAQFSWLVKARLQKNCTGDFISDLSFSSISSLAPADFQSPASCAEAIVLPCSGLMTDTLPPLVGPVIATNTPLDSQQFQVQDNRPDDDGLELITDTFVGKDPAKFSVSVNPPLAGDCDRAIHSVKVYQLDSTAAGCFDFVFTDCNANISYDTICFTAHPRDSTQSVGALATSLSTLIATEDLGAGLLKLSFAASQRRREVIVYDLMGKEVVRDVVAPGASTYTRPTSGLASGVYLVRLGELETKVSLVR